MFWLLCAIVSGCRCERIMASDLQRTDTGTIDVRFRSLTQLRDSLAERQTIRIEYYPPDIDFNGAFASADTTDTSSNLGSVPPCNTGGVVPAIKSIEIVSERNSGSFLETAKDSSMLSQTSTKESQQKERSSEARHDNGAVAIVSVVGALVVLAIFFIIAKRLIK